MRGFESRGGSLPHLDNIAKSRRFEIALDTAWEGRCVYFTWSTRIKFLISRPGLA